MRLTLWPGRARISHGQLAVPAADGRADVVPLGIRYPDSALTGRPPYREHACRFVPTTDNSDTALTTTNARCYTNGSDSPHRSRHADSGLTMEWAGWTKSSGPRVQGPQAKKIKIIFDLPNNADTVFVTCTKFTSNHNSVLFTLYGRLVHVGETFNRFADFGLCIA